MNINNQYPKCPGLMHDDRLFNDWTPHDLSYKYKLESLGIKNSNEFRNKVRESISQFAFDLDQKTCQINIDNDNIHKFFEDNLKNELNKKTNINSAYEFDKIHVIN